MGNQPSLDKQSDNPLIENVDEESNIPRTVNTAFSKIKNI